MTARTLVGAVAVLAVAGCRQPPARGPDTAVATASVPAPTFSKDVAPILATHCAGCHRPGQGAPFNLLTYADARPRAGDIAEATAARIMPPWLPDPIQPAFVGERRLSAEQIAVLRRWADAGAIEGGPGAPVPKPAPSDEWALGKPDVILRTIRAYPLARGEGDVFRNLVIRTALPVDRFIRAVEFRPGDAPVHHAVVHLDRTATSRNRDGTDGKPGFEGMGVAGLQDPEGHFVGWAPGRGPIVSAEGRPWRLAAGTDVVLELHLIPGHEPVAVEPSVGLYFAEAAGSQPPVMLKMGSSAIDIPAGETDYAISDQYTLPADVSLVSLYPHAHFLGKEMQVHAVLPNGRMRTLLRIPRWSFHWQQDYRFTEPVVLPRGTTIAMRFTYDNSEANKDNPHRPPVRVLSGQRSTDEMGNLLLQVIPSSPSDRAALERAVAERQAAANLASAEQAVRLNPRGTEALTFLGASYADVGRLPEAVTTLTSALKIDPASWKAHNELGGALFKSGRLEEAAGHFREASRLNPREASVQYNLGKALMALGAREPATIVLRRALALNPHFAEAHGELGVLLFAGGRLEEALRHLRRAVDLNPNSAMARSDLGGALAQAGKTEEALTQIRMALALDPSNGAARANLARLQRGR